MKDEQKRTIAKGKFPGRVEVNLASVCQGANNIVIYCEPTDQPRFEMLAAILRSRLNDRRFSSSQTSGRFVRLLLSKEYLNSPCIFEMQGILQSTFWHCDGIAWPSTCEEAYFHNLAKENLANALTAVLSMKGQSAKKSKI